MESDDRYGRESVLVHEFAHCVRNCGFSSAQHQRSEAAHAAALAGGAHGDATTYMMSNADEYWAELSQAWFAASARTDVNNGINARELVKLKDQPAAALLAEVYGDGEWRYSLDCPQPAKWSCA
jgi:hypothetical protein